MKNYEIAGQLNIFDLVREQQEPEYKTELTAGQRIWRVVKGDIEECRVHNEKPWKLTDGGYGYRLQIGSGWGVTTSSELGAVAFLNKEAADKVAHDFLITHEVILSENIIPKETVAYQYVRECDNRIMTAFYSMLEDGKVYIKEFMTYAHMMLPQHSKKAIKAFEKQKEFDYCDVVKVSNPEIVLKNMYLVRDSSDWDYAESRYSLAVG